MIFSDILPLTSLFSLYSPTQPPAPAACYQENQQCVLTGTNLISVTYGVTQVPQNKSAQLEEINVNKVDSWFPLKDECRASASNATFTYHGAEGEPYQEVCMLFSSCEVTSPCVDCFTESVTDCVCSLPYQCYVNNDNVLAMLEHPVANEKVSLCFK